MKCKSCSHDLPDDSVFCPYCGNKGEDCEKNQFPDISVSTEILPTSQHDKMEIVEQGDSQENLTVLKELKRKIKIEQKEQREIIHKLNRQKRAQRKLILKSRRRGGLIALCVTLALLVFGLSVILVFTIQQRRSTQSCLNEKISQLENKLSASENNLAHYKSQYDTVTNKLASANATIVEYKTEIEALKKQLLASDSTNVNYSYAFNSVADLMKEIKKNPTSYNNVQIKVVGTAYNGEANNKQETYLFDKPSGQSLNSEFDYQYLIWKLNRDSSNTLISIKIADDIQLAVLSSGDYIKLYGTIRIANGKIYLDQCTYEPIS